MTSRRVQRFEEWWAKWWSENAIVATDTERVLKDNAQAAWDAGYATAINSIASGE